MVEQVVNQHQPPSNGSEPKGNPTRAMLRTGLSIWSGQVQEEYLAELKPWSKAYKIYREMTNDAVIGAMLESIKTPLLSTPFEVDAGGDSDQDKAAAEFLEMNLFQLPGMTWREHVEEALDFLNFGFSLHEKVLEKRKDGRLYLAALTPIGQDTLYKWGQPDEMGSIPQFTQQDEHGALRSADMDKLLHFTFRSRKRNPEGISLLRSIYRAWFFRKNLETLEAIGAERDVGNAPIAVLGEGVYTDADITAIRDALEGFRVDEAMYLVVPHGTEITAYGGGSKVYNIREIIRDYDHKMRQRFFADFLSLGSEQVGTQALAKEMTTFFSMALGSIQARMLEVWNSQLVPWLMRWNDFEVEKLPTIGWAKVGARNLQSLAQAYNSLVGSGLLTPDESIEPQIRAEAGLPPLDPEVEESKRQILQLNLKRQVEEAKRPREVEEPESQKPTQLAEPFFVTDPKEGPILEGPLGSVIEKILQTGGPNLVRGPNNQLVGVMRQGNRVRVWFVTHPHQWTGNVVTAKDRLDPRPFLDQVMVTIQAKVGDLGSRVDLDTSGMSEPSQQAEFGLQDMLTALKILGPPWQQSEQTYRKILERIEAGEFDIPPEQRRNMIAFLHGWIEGGKGTVRSESPFTNMDFERVNDHEYVVREVKRSPWKRAVDRARGFQSVTSTNVRAIRYNPRSKQLFVKFRSGNTYEYEGVDEETWKAFVASPSKGHFVWEVIRNRGGDNLYPYKKVVDM